MKVFAAGLATLLMVSGLAAAADPANALTAAESKAGWKLLFDGKSLAGWEARPTSAPNSNGDWRVENGTIVCPGSTPGWLGTTESFQDYTLKVEFRGSEKVNSGLFLRSEKEGQPHVTGYELQIWDYQPAGYLTGSLVNSVKAEPTKIIPNAWNSFDVTANGDQWRIVLNGKTLFEGRDSKHTGAGLIGFQCQPNNKIEFRNIKVLPKK